MKSIFFRRAFSHVSVRHVAVVMACLLFFSAMGYTQQADPPQEERKAGDRMVLTIKDVKYAFRWCPPGTFMMGSPEDEGGMEPDEMGKLYEKQHRVTLTRGFWILETEVTQAMWASVMGANTSNFKGPNLPVEMVSWNDCQDFIKKLNASLAGTPDAPAGFKFSLPTEAQWEYACRAGTNTAYHFGDTLNNDQANFGNSIFEKPLRGTSEVGSYPANAWGLHDMHGNVFEWCLDSFAVYPDHAATDPIQPFPTGRELLRGETACVLRGGSWITIAWGCRSANRAHQDPSERNKHNFIGFRLAMICEALADKEKKNE